MGTTKMEATLYHLRAINTASILHLNLFEWQSPVHDH